jgi:uncharacterized SAM-binding protein YcdF (DUF218 family)
VRAPRTARRRRRLIVATLALAALGWIASVSAVVLTGRLDSRRASDAIVVLGAAQWAGRPSPVLRARLDHGAALWRERVAPMLLLTGGVGDGDTMSEAEVGRRYLVAKGIPASAILVERTGRTTGQSVRSAAAILRGEGLRRVVLVSDPFHALRLRILAARHGLDAATSPTRTSPIARNALTEWRYVLSESVKLPVAIFAPGA